MDDHNDKPATSHGKTGQAPTIPGTPPLRSKCAGGQRQGNAAAGISWWWRPRCQQCV